MKPKDYIIVIKDDITEFEQRINELLEHNYVFLGDLRITEEGCYMREMLKPVPRPPMQMPVPRSTNLKKSGDK